MAKPTDLTTAEVAKLLKDGAPGLYRASANLYMQVTGPKKGSWIVRYKIDGRERQVGLGSFHLLTLAEARQQAHEMRQQRLEGVDPLAHRRAAEQDRKLKTATEITFGLAYEKWASAQKSHLAEATYYNLSRLGPNKCQLIWNLPLRKVTRALILQVLKPIWKEMPTTGSALRRHMENIWLWAVDEGFIDEGLPNPARPFDPSVLMPLHKIHTVTHRKSVPHDELLAVMAKIHQTFGDVARALEFQILMTTRPREAAQARWSEFDLDARLWTIPAARMKKRREHKVPLSEQAIALLLEQKNVQRNPVGNSQLGRRVFELLEERPNLKQREVAEILNVATGTVGHLMIVLEARRQSWSRHSYRIEELLEERPNLRQYEVAEILDLPVSTVSNHMGRIHKKELSDCDLVFRSSKPGRCKDPKLPLITNTAKYGLLERLGIDTDPHGFRRTFGNWARNMRPRPEEDVIERQLAHKRGNKTTESYFDDQLLQPRLILFDLPPEKWTPNYANSASACSGVI